MPIIPGWKNSDHAFAGFNFNIASNNTACPSALSLHCASAGPQSPNTKSCSLSMFESNDEESNTVLGSSNVPASVTGDCNTQSHVYLAFRTTCVLVLLGFDTMPFVNALINASRFVSSPPFAVVRQSYFASHHVGLNACPSMCQGVRCGVHVPNKCVYAPFQCPGIDSLPIDNVL